MDRELLGWVFVPITWGATLAAIHKRWWAFLIFTATNTFWIAYMLCHEAYPPAVKYAGYFLVNAYGTWRWWP